jgi:hypothetical protein
LTACSDGSSTTTADTLGDGAGRAVQGACDLLADLGEAILVVGDASTLEEFRSILDMPMRRYLDAADETGDVELIDLASTAGERYEVYLSAPDPLDAREAGDDVNIALDRSMRRCLELGATTVFPQQPG